MAASRTPAATVPEELKRQSERVVEQLSQLNKILNTSISHLDEMSQMMSNYSPELVDQIKKLRTALDSYKGKSGHIYQEVANSLLLYSNGLLHNLDNLTTSVAQVTQAIEVL